MTTNIVGKLFHGHMSNAATKSIDLALISLLLTLNWYLSGSNDIIYFVLTFKKALGLISLLLAIDQF